MTAVSGITPSGHLTLGNYLGALRRFAERTDEPGFYFVADLHAMTTRHDPRRLATLTRETALLLLAAGLPEESVSIQSAVPERRRPSHLTPMQTLRPEPGIQVHQRPGRGVERQHGRRHLDLTRRLDGMVSQRWRLRRLPDHTAKGTQLKLPD